MGVGLLTQELHHWPPMQVDRVGHAQILQGYQHIYLHLIGAYFPLTVDGYCYMFERHCYDA